MSSSDPAPAPLLDVRDLRLHFATGGHEVRAVNGISFQLSLGETLGIVGESGSGKSVTASTVLRLIPSPPLVVDGGQILLDGRDTLTLSDRELQQVRGKDVGVVFQDPMSALNPGLTIGRQVMEPLLIHRIGSKDEARARAMELLELVGLSDPARRMRQYPHQLSGGMLQRVVIAMALAARPRLLIADEPTTALDATTRVQILDLLADVQQRFGMAMILITHDMGVVARAADRVAVMHDGLIVEQGPVEQIFARPAHPYTRALLAATPGRDGYRARRAAVPGTVSSVGTTSRATGTPPYGPGASRPVVEVEDLEITYQLPRSAGAANRTLTAVRGVSFALQAGEVLALVGESGSGKSSTGRALIGLERPTAGTVHIDGLDVARLGLRAARRFHRSAQMVFQDPMSSLNPRVTVGDAIARPLRRLTRVSRSEARATVLRTLELVGLTAEQADRYPHEFSGGQRQRVGIARALVVEPTVLICDEPVSALDVSIQAQVVDLLLDLRERLDLTMLFISHDMGVVREIADRVAVMTEGQIVEIGVTQEVFEHPRHPYTRTLLDSVLEPVVGSRVTPPRTA